jgi:hypothetical protein
MDRNIPIDPIHTQALAKQKHGTDPVRITHQTRNNDPYQEVQYGTTGNNRKGRMAKVELSTNARRSKTRIETSQTKKGERRKGTSTSGNYEKRKGRITRDSRRHITSKLPPEFTRV